MGRSRFTSESVTEGHPDKVCDQISDALVDACLGQDPLSKVAVETMVKDNAVFIVGEVTTKAQFSPEAIARGVIRDIGYTDPSLGFDAAGATVHVALSKQSLDIARGVEPSTTLGPRQAGHGSILGAGDQGMMFGYATNETDALMPLPITLAHRLARRLTEVRKAGVLPFLRPDGKTQVTVEYDGPVAVRVATVVVSAQHAEDVAPDTLREAIIEQVIRPVVPAELLRDTAFFINPTGRFVIGGPVGDSGLTGRKIIVDTYGGAARHGGGAFCVAGNAMVNTEHGLAPIRELSAIKRGTLVKTDISPAPIEAWLDNGERDTLKIETEDGFSLEGTLNQSIRVIDAGGNYCWRRFDTLQPADWIAIQRKNRLFGAGELPPFTFQHKPGTRRRNTFEFPRTLTEDYAYLLGLLIGDGRCTTRDGVQVCVCEPEMEDIIQGLFQRLFGRKGKIFGHWAFFCGVELRAFLAHLGLEYRRSWQKLVPQSVWTSPKSAVAAFLRGLFDTDGTVRRAGRNDTSADIKLTTTSRPLAEEIQQLLLSFGIVSHIQTVQTTGKTSYIHGRAIRSARPLHHVRIRGASSVSVFEKEIGFGLLRKACLLRSIVNEKGAKRNLLVIPNQRERVRRLWDKLPSTEHQRDVTRIGRWFRDPSTKGTKELTYEKLTEFLDAYEETLSGDPDFEYLRTSYTMGHYYTRIKRLQKSKAHVYDFVVSGVHTFTANGFVCHNSGKDPTKVDRSGAYAARQAAKSVVASGLATRCELQVAYVIGVADPISLFVETFGTGTMRDEDLGRLIIETFDFRPGSILERLQLRRPIYRPTAAYGHFGRDGFPWEALAPLETPVQALRVPHAAVVSTQGLFPV